MGNVPGLELKFVRKHRVPDPQEIRSMPKARGGVTVRGRHVVKSGQLSQKVVVKVDYRMAYSSQTSFKQSLQGKLGYLSRDGCLDAVDEKGNTLTLDEAREKLKSWGEDERYYDLVLSPESGHRLDLDEFASKTMAKLREDCLTSNELSRDVQVEYVQFQHWDKPAPHSHVLMRAKADDRELRLSNGYASHGLRSRAEEVATAMLGYRSERWQKLNLTKAQQKERKLAINEAKLPALMERRAERGLDPVTGKHPDEKTAAADSGKGVSKSKETSRDRRGFDGGLE
jgi:hypothetical protein